MEKHAGVEKKARCNWCEDDPLLIYYHDHEWGQAAHDDHTLFEFLTLELFQAGLSWRTILYKRTAFREAFAGFNPQLVASFGAADVDRLLMNAGIVRNRRKIEATLNNARVCCRLINEFKSLKSFLDTLPVGKENKEKILSQKFHHVGATTAESFLYATGIIRPPHDQHCFKFIENHCCQR